MAGYITWLLLRHQAGVHTVHWVQAGAGPATPHRAEGQQESDDDILQCTSIHQYGVKFKQKFKSELIKLWPGVGREFKACIQSWEHLRHPRGPQCSAAVLQGAGSGRPWDTPYSLYVTISSISNYDHHATLAGSQGAATWHSSCHQPAPATSPGPHTRCAVKVLVHNFRRNMSAPAWRWLWHCMCQVRVIFRKWSLPVIIIQHSAYTKNWEPSCHDVRGSLRIHSYCLMWSY